MTLVRFYRKGAVSSSVPSLSFLNVKTHIDSYSAHDKRPSRSEPLVKTFNGVLQPPSPHSPFTQLRPPSRPAPPTIYGSCTHSASSLEERLLPARLLSEEYQTWIEEARFEGGNESSYTQTRQERRTSRPPPHTTSSAVTNRLR